MIGMSGCLLLFSCTVSAFAQLGSPAAFTLLPPDTQLASEHPLWENAGGFPRQLRPAEDDQSSDGFQSDANRWQDEPAEVPRKRYVRAALETTTVLALASLIYWGTLVFEADFDYDVSLDTLRKKFTGEAIRFDDNPIHANSFPGHPLAGAYYYLIARNQHLSRLESFLGSLTASFLHEFFIELPEPASISDLVTTPIAGSTIGEAMYAFGRYFRCARQRQSLLYAIMAFVMDPIYVANGWIWPDGQAQGAQDATCRDLPPDNALSLFTGISMAYHEHTDRTTLAFLLGFDGRLYQLPQSGHASDRSGLLTNTSLTELGLEAMVTEHSVESLRFAAKTVWAAYYHQRIGRDFAGQATGWSFLAGLASAFEHTQYNTDEFDDWIGAVHVLGPAVELTVTRQNDYLRLGVDVFGDFAMVRSFAFDTYKQQHSLFGLKTVLQQENYYYASGVHVHPKLEVQYGAYRLVAAYTYAHYDSIEGKNRLQTFRDFHLEDTRAEYSVTVGRRLDFLALQLVQKYPVWLEAEWRRTDRTGWIADDAVTHAGGTMWLLLRLRMSL
jgi:Domain of unknown function (DUF3943)